MEVDVLGLIVTAGGDGGDTVHNHSTLEFHLKLNEQLLKRKVTTADFHMPEFLRPWKWTPADPRSAQQLLEPKRDGLYVRNPDPAMWYSDPFTTSRDAGIPIKCALGVNKQYKELKRENWQIIKRGFTAPNIKHNWDKPGKKIIGDPYWGHITIMIRPWGWWALPLYPLLLILDVTLLIGAVLDAFKKSGADEADDRNAINMHLAAVRWLPTPISWLARKIYSLTRPMSFGMVSPDYWQVIDRSQLEAWEGKTFSMTTLKQQLPSLIAQHPGEMHPVMAAWMWYCHRDYPELAEVARPLIYKYFPMPKRIRKNSEAQ